MRAIDTNVLVRFLARDNEDQAQRALAAILAGDVFVSKTVMLETEWVVRGVYGFSRDRVVTALREFIGLSGVTVESPGVVAQALERMQQGMDFADALQLGAAADCEVFLTFDRKLAKVAEGQARPRVEQP